jgi:glucose-1-phosphate adenylyltransferase
LKDEKLVILAGGISSRMRKPASASTDVDRQLMKEADNKAKSMIGVGGSARPFLDYLLFNAREEDYGDIVIVVGEQDDSIRAHYGRKDRGNAYHGLSISYAVQKIPAGRDKPLGTADALLCALRSRKDWKGSGFTVCNSDNLYSRPALRLMKDSPYPNALVDYDRSSLKFEQSRIEKFAVTRKDGDHFLVEIIEKPTAEQIESVRDSDGTIGVSMNIFRLDYDMILPYLESCPLNPVRHEKELPTAVINMIKDHPKTCYAYPLKEHIPDLTNRDDIGVVREYLEREFKDLTL